MRAFMAKAKTKNSKEKGTKANNSRKASISSKKIVKKKSKSKKKKKTSLFSILFKFIFISLVLGAVSYSLFFIKIEGKTAYSRIIKTLKETKSTQKPNNTKVDLVKNNPKNKKKTIVKPNKRTKDILRAKRRNRNLEKRTINKTRVDFINKKAISKKEKSNLDNIINSNL